MGCDNKENQGNDAVCEVRESYDCQLLYFTSSSCLKNNKGLVFIGEENGNPNVYYKEYATGQVKRLTENTEGILKSYVYFNGRPHKGLGKASVCLDQNQEVVYYLQGRNICRVDLQGEIRVLNQIPEDQVTAFMHVSTDGTRLCVPTSDWRTLEDPPHDGPVTTRPKYDIDDRVQKENLNSYLRVYDTATGEEVLCERVPKSWITHVQFHPQDNSKILYNHEWASDWGVRRIWLWNGTYHRALRTIDEGRNINDVVYHEVWSEDGSQVIYHGSYVNGRYYVGRITMETGAITEVMLPESYTGYGHFTISTDGLLVSDGYYQRPEDAEDTRVSWNKEAKWLTVQKVDWENKTIEWFPLKKHESSWMTQDAHPHPIFSPDGKRIYYTTDGSGKLEVRSCTVPEAARVR